MQKRYPHKLSFLLVIPALLYSHTLKASIWNVGAARTYLFPSTVSSLVSDGDTVYVDGGIYSNDAVTWNKKNLKLIGLGTAQNPTVLQYTGNIPNGKGIWVFQQPGVSDNPYIENITFSGAQVSDGNGGNGAGIRFQSVNLTVNNCKFFYCQNGILEGGSYTGSTVTLRNSEFAYNGYNGSMNSLYGYEHHIYISACTDSLEVTNCWFHDPRGQANSFKTRAQKSFILYNLIDEAAGNGSWELDIAQGGLVVVLGNTIIQGTSGANHGIVGWDATTNPIEELYFINNTVINKYRGNIRYVNVAPASGIQVFKFYNNIFASNTGASNTQFSGNVPGVIDTVDNLWLNDYTAFNFVSADSDNFNLLPTASLAIDHGTTAGVASNGFSLTPLYTFQADSLPLVARITSGSAIDIGAYEYEAPSEVAALCPNNGVKIFPNPIHSSATISINNASGFEQVVFTLYDALGQEVQRLIMPGNTVNINRGNLSSGVYYYKLMAGNALRGTGKLLIE